MKDLGAQSRCSCVSTEDVCYTSRVVGLTPCSVNPCVTHRMFTSSFHVTHRAFTSSFCVTHLAFISSFRRLNRCSSNQWAVKWLQQENTVNRQFWLPVNSASLCLDLFISSETKQGRKEQFRSRAPAETTAGGTARAEPELLSGC